MILRILFLSFCLIVSIRSQENAVTSVSKSLYECYNQTETLDRELRPPATLNVLLDLIRRVESGPSIQNDREFAIEIVHRFKQDGITRTSPKPMSQYTIPYSPKAMQSDKYRLLLKKFLPGDATKFPNSTLTAVQRCSLHFMLSNSVGIWKRGDENQVCSRLGRYQRRTRRGVNPDDQVEVFNPESSSLVGNLQDEPEDLENPPEAPKDEVESTFSAQETSRVQFPYEFSDCPVENGVISTRWGAVTPGTVIAAIAAGRQGLSPIQSKEDYRSDPKFATTLAGELAELALHQGSSGKDRLILGVQGSWNNTQAPRWYFIKTTLNWEMTAAEIRGALDGLIIAKNIKDWKNKFPMLKLSQTLDMYYSSKGVFSKKYRACNRQTLFTEVAPREDLLKETIAFSLLLDDEAKLPGTMTTDGVKAYSEKAVDALLEYVPSNLNDLTCVAAPETTERVNTDIIIVLDTQWDYNVIHRALSYLLDNLDINQYNSNYTIVNAKSGETIINTTNSIVDFYTNYTRPLHYGESAGFDAQRAYRAIDRIVLQRMSEDRISSKAGGQSTIALFVVYNTLSPNDKSAANSMKLTFRNNRPDLKLLALGRGSKEGYVDLVFDGTYDAFGLTDTVSDNIKQDIDPVIERVKQIPLKVVNPNCDSNLNGSPGSFSLDQYVELGGINYYRISPHYLFGEDTKTLEIQAYSYGNLVVCNSRQTARPQQNFTQGDVKCEPVSGNGKASFSFTDPCSGYDNVLDCASVYFSVQSTATGSESTSIRCNDAGCRFPDDIKYTIKLNNFGCESGTLGIIGNAVLVMTMILSINFIF